MATIAGINLTTSSRVLAKATDYSPKAPRSIRSPYLNQPWKKQSGIHFGSGRLVHFRPARTAPDGISERLAESVKKAEEMCESNPDTGECAASWDEVEELSAAASHARDRKKAEAADPLEAFCKDNPETKECRTYED
ncbi:calvin cycle protein CP12-2, chloroplastic-like [Carica papaya]|uniref:calvin cycle protein CP12-2, chloroplastic-like n=1 Tax=Carica papaya TaxID=3649 RepID=UPI000B8CB10F|nr:calvin cycle protein CP12-2, chloroplastic-like [Carica papaya]